MNDSSNKLSYCTNSYLDYTTKETISQLSDLDIEKINNIRNHYLCTQCLKFPYIIFCKDRKYIRLTCSCFNNKKILIKDIFEKNIIFCETNNNLALLSSTNLNLNDENELICKKHNKIFKFFSKNYLDNYCQSCIDNNKFITKYNYDSINFDDIKIEDIKIEQLLKKINNNSKIFDESSNDNTYKIIDNNNGICIVLSEEEEEKFNKLINIIINDYKNYPNFSHFFNIKNLLYFFNIEDKPIIEKELIKLDRKFMKIMSQLLLNIITIFQIKQNYLVRHLLKIIKKNLTLK